MIWVIRIFLLGYAILYFGIGAWAIIDPVKDALDLSEIPSYMNAVGLTVSSEIGYSEVAGLYGGINMVVGLLCFLGLFSRGIAAYAFSILAFLTLSIALGRFLFALIPSTPTYLNAFFGSVEVSPMVMQRDFYILLALSIVFILLAVVLTKLQFRKNIFSISGVILIASYILYISALSGIV